MKSASTPYPWLLIATPFLLLLGLWLLIPYTGLHNPIILPELGKIIGYIGQSALKASFWLDIAFSVGRVWGAFALSVLIALPVGLAAAFSKTASRLAEPFSEFIRYLPVPAFVPLFIMWFGFNDSFMIATIMLGTVFQLLLMVADIGRDLNREYYDAALTLGASRWQLFRRVLWPATLPQVFNACRIAIGWAWTYLIVAEIVNAGGRAFGLGLRILEAQRLAQTYKIFAGIIVIGAIGILTDQLFRRVYRWRFKWLDLT